MLTYLRNLYTAAKTKVTTYLALAVAGFAQLADKAQDLHDSLGGDLARYLPSGPTIAKATHYALTGLGFLIVWSRVRRILKPAQP